MTAILTTSQLATLTGYTPKTLERERKAGRLAGERRAGVRGYAHPVKSVRAWLRYKGLNNLLEKLP